MWPIESHGLSPMSIHRKWKKSWKFNILHLQVCVEKNLIPKPRVWVPDPSLVQLKLRILYIFQKNGRLYDMLMTFFFQMRIGYESSFLTRTNFTKKLRVFPLKKVGNHASLAQTIFRWRKRWLCRRWFSDMAGLQLTKKSVFLNILGEMK